MKSIINRYRQYLVTFFEALVIIIISLALFFFIFQSILFFLTLNWSTANAFEQFIQRVLLFFVGIELLQIIRSHNLKDMFIIIIFVVARRSLEPFISAQEMFFLALSLIFLILTWTFISRKQYTLLINEPK